MNIDQYKELQQYFLTRAEYFKNVEFLIIASDYEKAANGIGELIALVENSVIKEQDNAIED